MVGTRGPDASDVITTFSKPKTNHTAYQGGKNPNARNHMRRKLVKLSMWQTCKQECQITLNNVSTPSVLSSKAPTRNLQPREQRAIKGQLLQHGNSFSRGHVAVYFNCTQLCKFLRRCGRASFRSAFGKFVHRKIFELARDVQCGPSPSMSWPRVEYLKKRPVTNSKFLIGRRDRRPFQNAGAWQSL